ncbi:choice-of-anchor M domain-containing protein [Actinotignum sanguinis]|uniref:choice-of-anchor M domain-containing protein n=1 Tax=Actinotignum sanguinis TaxID=1445614 RepID=UPI00254CA789|nr:choice-of-anchor M domain-containing protein [Actinotignum sanguinis]MDK7197919.1 choice-of-anchor M domain-containing protein [Actinotignum sanguinis]
MARRFLAALAAAALTAGIAPAAAAAPDDGKIVTTTAHVDAPKVFWENGTFVLKNEAYDELYPLEKTVNWVGRGYARSGSNKGGQQYIFLPPDNEAYGHLRNVAERWYSAPGMPSGPFPIWAGFGADAAIPVEQFRNGTFALELTKFDGPGRMEAFMTNMDLYLPLFSSHEPGRRVSYLVPGSHTHNETAFTKPGRYTLTYRAIARGVDGNIIASQEIPFVWQVGGTRPAKEAGPDLATAFNAAPTGDTSGYRFSLAPYAGREHDGDDQLTELRFDAGSETVQGKVQFFLDGYFLAEVPVERGKARWAEMIGSGASNFQAVFVPTAGGGTPGGDTGTASATRAAAANIATGARWVSATVSYTFGAAEAATAESAAQLPEPHSQDPAPAFVSGEYTPSSYDYTVRTEKTATGNVTTSVAFADPKVRAHVHGGYYAKAEDRYPDCEVNMVTDSRGVASVTQGDAWCEGYHLKLSIEPHPDVNMSAAADVHFGTMELSGPQSYSGRLAAAPAIGTGTQPAPGPQPDPAPGPQPEPGPNPAPTPGPNPPAPAPTPSLSPSAPAPAPTPNPAPSRTILRRGHVDLQAVAGQAGQNGPGITLKDDTLEHATTSVQRDVSTVALAVPDSAKSPRAKGAAFNFLGAEGTRLYQLPQNWDRSHIWPGWSTESYRKPTRFHVEPESIPAGAQYHAYALSGFGNVDRLFDTERTALDLPDPTHQHAGWAFTQPGVYVVRVWYDDAAASAAERGTATPVADPGARAKRLVFLVGDETISGYEQGTVSIPGDPTAPEPGGADNPSTDPTPGGNPGGNPGGTVNPGGAPTPGNGASTPPAPGTTPAPQPSSAPETPGVSTTPKPNPQPGIPGMGNNPGTKPQTPAGPPAPAPLPVNPGAKVPPPHGDAPSNPGGGATLTGNRAGGAPQAGGGGAPRPLSPAPAKAGGPAAGKPAAPSASPSASATPNAGAPSGSAFVGMPNGAVGPGGSGAAGANADASASGWDRSIKLSTLAKIMGVIALCALCLGGGVALERHRRK